MSYKVFNMHMCTRISKGPTLSIWSYAPGGSKDFSNEPKTIAVCENAASLEPVKDGGCRKPTFRENKNEVVQGVLCNYFSAT